MALTDHLYYTRSYIINYPEGDSSLQRNRLTFKVNIEDQFHNVIDGDDLTQLAYRYYGNPILWYVIADANEIENPFELESGSSLLIPSASQLSNSINFLGNQT